MRIFQSFLIMLASVFLWLLPVTTGVYAFRTDVRTDEFVYPTGVGATTANITLHKAIYDNDTATIDLLSNTSADVPLYSSYNTATRALVMTGLSANTTRTLSVSYDIDALNNAAWDKLLDVIPFLYMVLVFAFPIAGLVAIWTGKAG